MSKLPVLFVSCNVENLKAQKQANSGTVRMVWGSSYDSVVIISTSSEIEVFEIHDVKGQGESSEKIRSLLKEQGFQSCLSSEDFQSCENLVQILLTDEPGDLAELRLATGMCEFEYRQIGQCLGALREQGVLVIFLDDQSRFTDGSNVSLHDRHFREMINSWVQDQQWSSAISLNGVSFRKTQTPRLDDPTLCLLNAAFTLGGSRFPQRVFGSDMNDSEKMLSGFGWIK